MTNELPLEVEYELLPIPPHQYPNILKISFILFILIFGYVCTLVPTYVNASRHLKKAQQAHAQNNYIDAVESYLKTLSFEPNSKKARIGLAKIFFKDKDPVIQMDGLELLAGLELISMKCMKLDKQCQEDLKNFLQGQRNDVYTWAISSFFHISRSGYS